MKTTIDSIDRESEWVKEFYEYAKSIPRVSLNEEKQLFREYKAGDDSAKERIMDQCLLRLFGIVNNYIGMGVPTEDLINEAYARLLSHIDDYSIDRNYSFLNAYYQDIQRTLDNYVAVNTGARMKHNSIFPVRHGSREELNRDAYKSSFTDIPFEDKVEDKVYIEQLLKYFEESGMKGRTLEIYKMRLGYGQDREYTQDEIGPLFNISRSRVYQIEKNVARKIDRISKVDNFEFYVPEIAEVKMEVKQRLNMDDILRTRMELTTKNYDLLLNFSKEELEEIRELLPPRKLRVVDKIFKQELASPTLQDVSKPDQKFFFREIYPRMISILDENRFYEKGLKLRRYEENELINQREAIIIGLTERGPCKGFTLEELSLVVHKSIKELQGRIAKTDEKLQKRKEKIRAKYLTK